MAILHMNTDDVREVASQLLRTADDISDTMNRLRQSSHQLSAQWSGAGSEHFMGELNMALHSASRLAGEGTVLGRRALAEVQEWEEVDNNGTAGLSGMVNPRLGPGLAYDHFGRDFHGWRGTSSRQRVGLDRLWNSIKNSPAGPALKYGALGSAAAVGLPASAWIAPKLAGALGLAAGGVAGSGAAAAAGGLAATAWMASGGGLVSGLMGAGGAAGAGMAATGLAAGAAAAHSGMAGAGIAATGGAAAAGLAAAGGLAGAGVATAGMAAGALAASPMAVTGGMAAAGLNLLGSEKAAKVVSNVAKGVGTAVNQAANAVADFGAGLVENTAKVVGSAVSAIGRGIRSLFGR